MAAPFHLEKLDRLPIVLWQPTKEYELTVHLQESIGAVAALLDTIAEPVHFVLDWTAAPSQPMEGLTEGASAVTRDDNPLFLRNDILSVSFAAPDAAMTMVAEGLSDAIFGGGIDIAIYPTLDDALDALTG